MLGALLNKIFHSFILGLNKVLSKIKFYVCFFYLKLGLSEIYIKNVTATTFFILILRINNFLLCLVFLL